jgi:hypothetical protein
MSEQPQEDEGKCRIHGEYLDDMGDCPVCEEVCEEASRGMSEHHPSCRESDKDLVWHCSQCGLNEPASEQPQELEQRITAYLASGGLFNPEMMEHDKVRDLLLDCRAALAAELATSSRVAENARNLHIENVRLGQQLAAEREKVLLKVSQDRTATGHASKIEQIALELKQELAAEREKVKPLIELLLRLREFTEAWNEPELTQQIDALAKVKGAK